MKKLALGIDIGGTNTAFEWVDAAGNPHGEGSFSTAGYPDFEEYLHVLFRAVQDVRPADAELVGVGVGAPNANGRRGTIEHAPNLPWGEAVAVAERIGQFFPDVPVRVANDADAAALGECLYGAARGMKDFAVVTLGTGVGSGFVAGGKLLAGRDGWGAELGHVTVEPGGRLCGCGRRGCLETYAAAGGVCRTVFELLAEGPAPSELRGVAPDELTTKRIFEAAERGDTLARRVWQATGERLGRALADAVLITGPEAIVLFGGVARAGEMLFGPTRKSLEANLLENYKGRVKLLPSGVPAGRAAVLGAAALVWHESM